MIIEIYYPALTNKDSYLKPAVLVEAGSRSLKEPFTQRSFSTIISEVFADRPFAGKSISIPAVNPERTFLEKIFPLHEEFQKPQDKIRVERLSRHLYDNPLPFDELIKRLIKLQKRINTSQPEKQAQRQVKPIDIK